MVMATQNPIEQEGTYPLPEAQVDRFMFKVTVTYPTRDEERMILDRMAGGPAVRAEPVATPQNIADARSVLNQIYIDDKIKDYIVNIVHATREPKAYGLSELADFIHFGASPRASIYLNLAARAHAFLRRRGYVTPEDIKAIGTDVLRHRVILTYEAEAEEMTSEAVVRKIFENVEVP
jgi:MoxR-like ATPase